MALETRASHARHPLPDANRVAGYSVAIAFNALLLMLLLVPMQGPPALKLPGETPPAITWYLPRTQQPVPPPRVPVVQPRPAAGTAVAPRTIVPQTPDPVIVDQGSELARVPILPDPPAIEAVDSGTPAQQVAGVRLEYAQAPAPVYPRAALRARIEGTVLLEVLVDIDGRPVRVSVREGSGDRRLDAAAREQVLARWRFRPAVRDGRAVQAIGLVPISFRLR